MVDVACAPESGLVFTYRKRRWKKHRESYVYSQDALLIKNLQALRIYNCCTIRGALLSVRLP